MKMKRFSAPDIRQAIRQVRDELGPDAVILSNRSTSRGVEIVAAVDYDETSINDIAVSESGGESYEALAKNITVAGRPSLKESQSSIDEEGFSHTFSDVDDNENAPDQFFSSAGYSSQKQTQQKRPPAEDAMAMAMDSHHEALSEMKKELQFLRGLLENQLSGLAWGDLVRRHPQQAELHHRLMKLGLSATLCREIVDDIPLNVAQKPDIDVLWRRALGILAHRVEVTGDDILNQGGVVALIGPTGVGKTTTIAKLAARYALRHGSRHVALVTTDNYRIGAHEHLRSYGRILNIPVRIAGDREELQAVLEDMADRRLILIDTAGMGQRDGRLSTQFSMLNSRGSIPPVKTYLVLSATTRLSGLEEIASVFHGASLEGCIITKIDEATSLGSALSTAIQNKLPIAYVSDGQRVPEDLHNARAHTLVSRSVAIMQQSALMLENESLMLSVRKVAAHAHV
ncbi:MAG: flagellar biosynthesis protein FlhF [Gammaproteobacteria bacterium]|nr:flagellar biosynthesis protein FlhF [Gammaproteobacteria bacterium]